MDVKESTAPSTQGSLAMAQAPFIAAPMEGVTESIPVTGVIIDYDYARNLGTLLDKTSVRPHHSLNYSVFIVISLLL